jgi:hypothetical protein
MDLHPSVTDRSTDRDDTDGRIMTPPQLALAAAGLLLRQDLWGHPSSSQHDLGQLSVFGSLCVAAGGSFTEDGNPGPPEEPAAAEVLACTCELLVTALDNAPPTDRESAARRLELLDHLSAADSVNIQRLLATIYQPRPPL